MYIYIYWEIVFILPEMNPYSPGFPSLENSPQTVFLDVIVCPVSDNQWPLTPYTFC